MSEEDAKSFVVKALSFAMARDASSGGCIRTVTIDESGVRRDFLPGSQVNAVLQQARVWGIDGGVWLGPWLYKLVVLCVNRCVGLAHRCTIPWHALTGTSHVWRDAKTSVGTPGCIDKGKQKLQGHKIVK